MIKYVPYFARSGGWRRLRGAKLPYMAISSLWHRLFEAISKLHDDSRQCEHILSQETRPS